MRDGVQTCALPICDKIRTKGIRNSTITTVAPTGSGAIVSRVTSGIEPIFATSYKRRVKKNDGYGRTFDEYKVFHPVISQLFGGDEDLPDYVVSSHNIDPYFRVKMQGVIQNYIDSSISSRSEEHTSELQSRTNLVCRLLLEKKKKKNKKKKKKKQPNHSYILTHRH